MKNIICLIGQLGNGGSERQLSLFLKHLDRTKYNPAVVVTSNSVGRWEDYIKNELSIPVIALGGSSALIKTLKYRLFLMKFRPEAVICWSFFANPLCKASWGTNFVGALRNSLPAAMEELGPLRLKLALSPKNFIVNSSMLRGQLIDEGIADEKVHLIWNIFERTADFADPVKRENIKRELRKKYNVPEDAVVVGWAGRDNPVKGLSFFMEAFEKTIDKVPGIHAFLGGSGSLAVKDEIKRKGLEKYFTVAGDIKDIRFTLPLADIFFLSSTSEGMPNILIEAIDAGCGVLATDVGGVRNILEMLDEDELSKVVLENRDPDNASQKLTALCLDKTMRNGISTKAARALELMEPRKVMSMFMKLIEK
ncbi:MAG: hypothetical protein A2020_06290 [Lentisphaerae bacterium GWF2_45_14]|nr:MAG: hypothetical protein A2020_06290 [Lentisphaerae bacterium GWF2_45_14]